MLVLSHEEQRERLARAVPEALSTAVVAGDPCYDRILASTPHRDRYRAAFGVDDGRQLVVVSSTWYRRSLLGSWPDLFRRLLTELPIDSYQVVGILHPNIWHGHSPWQTRTWLADCLRSGLVLVPPGEGWRAALVAADHVIGDHGSVTGYGAALNRPVLLGAFPDEDVAAGSPVDLLGGITARLDRHRSVREQLETNAAAHDAAAYRELAELISSVPGESLVRLRREFYSVLALSEPPGEPPVAPVAVPGAAELIREPRITATVVHCTGDLAAEMPQIEVVRYPAEMRAGTYGLGGENRRTNPAGSTQTVVHATHPGQQLRSIADLVVIDEGEVPGGAAAWLAETMRPGSSTPLAAVALTRGDCVVRTRDGETVLLSPLRPVSVDPTIFASVAYHWLTVHRTLHALGPRIDLWVGTTSVELSVRPWTESEAS